MKQPPKIPDGYEKRSFLRFADQIDLIRLRAEVAAISDGGWRSPMHAIHSHTESLILRGGAAGETSDVGSVEGEDSPWLGSSPYMRHLLSEHGPFGRAASAYCFRTAPFGKSSRHVDQGAFWQDTYRIHIPIITNAEALILVQGRALHLAAGHAWSFDNQAHHAVVNGAEARTHLLLDVPFNPKLQLALDKAELIEGEDAPALWQSLGNAAVERKVVYPGSEEARSIISKLVAKGKSPEQIAKTLNQLGTPAPKAGASWTVEAVETFTA